MESWELKRRAELARQGAVLHEMIKQMLEILSPLEVTWLLMHEARELLFKLSHDEWLENKPYDES